MEDHPLIGRCSDATRKVMFGGGDKIIPNILDIIDNDSTTPNASAWFQCVCEQRVSLADAFIWREFYDVYTFYNELVMHLLGTRFWLVNPRLIDVFNLYDHWGGTPAPMPGCCVEGPLIVASTPEPRRDINSGDVLSLVKGTQHGKEETPGSECGIEPAAP